MLFFNFSVLLFGITNVNCKSWHDTYFFCFSSSSVLGSLFAIHVAYSSNIVLPNLIWLMHVVYKPLNPFFFIYLNTDFIFFKFIALKSFFNFLKNELTFDNIPFLCYSIFLFLFLLSFCNDVKIYILFHVHLCELVLLLLVL